MPVTELGKKMGIHEDSVESRGKWMDVVAGKSFALAVGGPLVASDFLPLRAAGPIISREVVRYAEASMNQEKALSEKANEEKSELSDRKSSERESIQRDLRTLQSQHAKVLARLRSSRQKSYRAEAERLKNEVIRQKLKLIEVEAELARMENVFFADSEQRDIPTPKKVLSVLESCATAHPSIRPQVEVWKAQLDKRYTYFWNIDDWGARAAASSPSSHSQ
jgi:hypothetical protein